MTELDPKTQFQAFHKEEATQLQANREARWLKTSLLYSLAHMTHQSANDKELAGARRFIAVFLNLWEPIIPPPIYPVKSLDTFEPSSPPITGDANQEKAP
jgi:hypothetical protein